MELYVYLVFVWYNVTTLCVYALTLAHGVAVVVG